MSSDFLSIDSTVDGDNAMEIDREEIAEAEAVAISEEEKYPLMAMEFSSLHRAGKVRENKDIGGGGRGRVDGERISRVRPLPVLHYHRNMVI